MALENGEKYEVNGPTAVPRLLKFVKQVTIFVAGIENTFQLREVSRNGPLGLEMFKNAISRENGTCLPPQELVSSILLDIDLPRYCGDSNLRERKELQKMLLFSKEVVDNCRSIY